MYFPIFVEFDAYINIYINIYLKNIYLKSFIL